MITTTAKRRTLGAIKVTILDLLDAEARPMTTLEIATALGRKENDDTARLALKALVASGEVRREKAGHRAAKFWTVTETEGEGDDA